MVVLQNYSKKKKTQGGHCPLQRVTSLDFKTQQRSYSQKAADREKKSSKGSQSMTKKMQAQAQKNLFWMVDDYLRIGYSLLASRSWRIQSTSDSINIWLFPILRLLRKWNKTELNLLRTSAVLEIHAWSYAECIFVVQVVKIPRSHFTCETQRHVVISHVIQKVFKNCLSLRSFHDKEFHLQKCSRKKACKEGFLINLVTCLRAIGPNVNSIFMRTHASAYPHRCLSVGKACGRCRMFTAPFLRRSKF